MKKLTRLFFVVLTLLPFAATPVQTHAQETAAIKAEQLVTAQPLGPALPSLSRIPEPAAIQEPDQHNAEALAITVTGGASASAFFSKFAVAGATLSSGLLSLATAPVVVSGLLTVGVGYGFYQLGSSLGVATADIVKTNASLYESAAADPAMQQALTAFAISGIDSTTSTYDFSQGLQTRYAQDVTSNALMREYLTGTTDHGAYRFSVNTSDFARKTILYNSLWSERGRVGVIGRDASVVTSLHTANQFFLLESIQLRETTRGSDQAELIISGEAYTDRGFPQPFVYETLLTATMSALLAQIPTQEALLDYIQQTTTYEFGVIDTPSREVAVSTARQMAGEYTARTARIADHLAEALAPTNNGLSFDPSGMIATLYGQTVVLDETGNFVYADTRVAVPEYQWGAIDFTYNAAAIPVDDAITIDGRRGLFDPDTGNIVDQFGHVLLFAPLGVWTRELYNTLVEQLKQYEENEDRWYTPLDLYYDEHHADKGKGHTLERHSRQSWTALEQRMKEKERLNQHASFYNCAQALVMINYAIWTAKNQELLAGSSKLNLGNCTLQKPKNDRIRYESHGYLSLGLSLGRGIERIHVAGADDEFKRHNHISYARVIIQKTNEIIRKNRRYYILTAFPDLERQLQENPQKRVFLL
ncbi:MULTISPECIES: RNase A-like domain-containing protein [unclassified Enterococcus]|uniref:RNase A-like domain-containing protein n=1 Tax=unclassified Enterococcus TaxID=2608891 RepID=UPI0013EADD73|nr:MULTISPECIES: RNase A-like domain-containing protein [unclassified Enterococcus]